MEQAEKMEFISPFSYIQHQWKLDWELITSNAKFDKPNENRTEKEEKALEAIATVGVIGGLQLKNIFGISKLQLKSMRDRNLVVKHMISKDGKEIPIYTIGKYGANAVMPEYEENYWIEMDTIKVLKCLAFFQFCYLFDEPEIIPAPDPFTAGIRIKGNPFYIYVERNGMKDLLLYLKWKKRFKERVFVITEKLDYIKDVEIFMETEQPLKLRVILDEELKKRKFQLYHYETNSSQKWKKS